MTFQISRRGKQYLETAQTLLRAARTMTDSAIADQLKALADHYGGVSGWLRVPNCSDLAAERT